MDGAELALADEPRFLRSSTRPYPYDEEPQDGLLTEDINGDIQIRADGISSTYACHAVQCIDGGCLMNKVYEPGCCLGPECPEEDICGVECSLDHYPCKRKSDDCQSIVAKSAA